MPGEDVAVIFVTLLVILVVVLVGVATVFVILVAG